jgi:neutral ceramidase
MTDYRVIVAGLVLAMQAFAAGNAPTVLVGTAKVDITPELPIRLAGYQARQTEANEVKQPLFARAIAIGSDEQKPAVLITVELVGIAEKFSDEIAHELGRTHTIDRAHVAICATHTHTGPMLAGVLPFMYSADLPADETARIERYTVTLQKKLVALARAALADRKPARLAWGQGSVALAGQRRVIANGKWTGFGHDPNGPVDRALPVLRVSDERGEVRAIFFSYACHCTTLGGRDNFVHPDWAGDAAARVEIAHAGSIALAAIGCGADANPATRGSLDNVMSNGKMVADEVERVLGGPLRSLGAVTGANYRSLTLDLDHVVTRQELQERLAGKPKQTIAYAATKFLQQLETTGSVPKSFTLPVQSWQFGRELTMVFLGGEVVSDYSLRLKREVDASRLWVNAYANSVPSYIASKRIFPEGGYEVDGSMDYYGWPTRLALGTEDRIIAAVHEMIPNGFKTR